MESRNVLTYREGHEAFNRRDFDAMVKEYAESICWIDRARGVTFRTPQEFKDDFLAGWIQVSSDCRVTDARYTAAGEMVVARFTGEGTNDGALGRFPATGKQWTLPICEMWHFDADGSVVGGEIYYDQVSLLTQLGLLPESS
ncbi:MAG TPA: nuclear transport factor 2 family protein [Gaiellaceae bacterium]|nr:nuclear transport factor 2 family protein [Gaiellaceae bacterium]